MTGVESQFGFEEDALIQHAGRLGRGEDAFQFMGVHVYFGTQISGVEALVANTRCALESAQRLAGELGLECAVVNAGGGFPWPYASAHAPPDLSGLKDALAGLVQQNSFARQIQLWFESGRYLSAAAGTLVATVLDCKESKGGKKYVVLDTGINHLGGMSGLGRIPRPTVALVPLSATGPAEPVTVDVVGPLCSPLDSLARGMKAPALAPGDRVAIPNVGAYGLSASLIGFLSHPPPIEVAVRGSQVVETWRWRWGHEQLPVKK